MSRSPPRSPRSSSKEKLYALRDLFRTETSPKIAMNKARNIANDQSLEIYIKNDGILQILHRGNLPFIKYLYKLNPNLLLEIEILRLAVEYDQVKIVQYLLSVQKYTDKELYDILNTYIIYKHIEPDKLLILRLLLRENPKNTYIGDLLKHAIASGNHGFLSLILEETHPTQKVLDEALIFARVVKPIGITTGSSKEIRDIIILLLEAGARPGKDDESLIPLPKMKKLM